MKTALTSLLLLATFTSEMGGASTLADISGRVVDAIGGPSAGVRVCAYPLRANLETPGPDAVVECATASVTDTFGGFDLWVEVPGMWRVRVVQPEVAMEVDLAPILESTELPDLVLYERDFVALELSSEETGRAIEGAHLDFRGSRKLSRPAPNALAWVYSAVALTSREGAAQVELPRSADLEFEVEIGGFGTMDSVEETALEKRFLKLVVGPTETHTVRVTDSADEPEAGISLRRPNGTSLGLTGLDGRVSFQSRYGHEGNVVLYSAETCLGVLEIPDGRAIVSARLSAQLQLSGGVFSKELGVPLDDAIVWFEYAPSGFVRTGHDGRFQIAPICGRPFAARRGFKANAAAGGALESRFELDVLPETGFVSGTVVDSDGVPIEGAELVVKAHVGVEDGEKTLGNGTFGITIQGVGTHTVQVRHEDYRPTEVEVSVPFQGIEEDLGQVVLAEGSPLAGTAIDSAGEPLPGVEIFANTETTSRRPGSSGRLRELPAAVSDDQGVFVIEHLATGDRIRIEAWKEGFLPAILDEYQVSFSGEPLQLQLTPALALKGIVLTEVGEPVEGAWVMLSQHSSTLLHVMPAQTMRTDEEGTFTFEGLRPAPANLAISALELEAFEGELPLPQAGTVRFVLGPGGTLTGVVRSAGGSPLADASVRVDVPNLDESLLRVDRTDGSGEFRLDGLSVGTTRLEVEHPNFQQAIRDLVVVPGIQRIDIELVPERQFAISGYVLDDLGGSVSGARILMTPEGGGLLQSDLSRQDGSYYLGPVSPGSYRIRIRHPRLVLKPMSERVTVQDFDVYDFTLQTTEGTQVVGTVPGLGPDTLSHAWISAESGERSRRTELNPKNGRFQLQRLLPGDWLIYVKSNAQGVIASQRVEIREVDAGAVLQIELELRAQE